MERITKERPFGKVNVLLAMPFGKMALVMWDIRVTRRQFRNKNIILLRK